MQEEMLQDGQISKFVDSVWAKYDTDGSGALDKMETLKFLNEFMELKEKPKVSFDQFNKFFLKFDENGDGELCKDEMIKFLDRFMQEEMLSGGQISKFIESIWAKYDADGSGALDKSETLKFLNEFMELKQKPKVTKDQFDLFFKKFDMNGDEEIGKDEMLEFI